MSAAAAKLRQPFSVGYLSPELGGRGGVVFSKGRKGNTREYDVTAVDGRAAQRGMTEDGALRRYGFAMLRVGGGSADGGALRRIENPYVTGSAYRTEDTPESAASREARERFCAAAVAEIRRVTGAKYVFVLSHAVRDGSKPAVGQETLPPTYARFAHVDFNNDNRFVAQSWKVLRSQGVPEADARRSTVAFYNLWAPAAAVERDPLAVCDWASVDRADVHSVDFGYKVAANQGRVVRPMLQVLTHNPKHAWHVFPDMRPGEAILFSQIDPRPGRAAHAFHTSPVDSAASPAAARRWSIELRIAVGYAPPADGKL